MMDIRPIIALKHSVQDFFAKTLANRLQKVLDKCISVDRLGFVAGKSITNNVLVCVKNHTLYEMQD